MVREELVRSKVPELRTRLLVPAIDAARRVPPLRVNALWSVIAPPTLMVRPDPSAAGAPSSPVICAKSAFHAPVKLTAPELKLNVPPLLMKVARLREAALRLKVLVLPLSCSSEVVAVAPPLNVAVATVPVEKGLPRMIWLE